MSHQNISDLIDLLPACIDTKKNEPFNNYWLDIQKRSVHNIQYIVRYVCDTYKADELSGPLYERILHKTCSHDLEESLKEMLNFLCDQELMGKYMPWSPEIL